jgi:uncharacterized protein (TIGR00297 family)
MTTLLGLLALAALTAAAVAFRLPRWATVAFAGLAAAVYLSADVRLFLAFVLSFALILLSKLAPRVYARASDMSEWRPANFLYSAGPPVFAVLLGWLTANPGPWALAALAGLAVVVADTAATELGTARQGPTVLITTGRAVAPGTDGGISAVGSAASLLWTLSFAAGTMGLYFGLMPLSAAAWIAASGVFGNVIDSILGATLQRQGWLTNEQVNGVTVTATILATYLVYG